MKRLLPILLIPALFLAGCRKDNFITAEESELGMSPVYGLVAYDGPRASDFGKDIVDMADEDTYWETVGFKSHIVITYSEEGVDIQGCPWIKRTVEGSDVMLDIAENKKTEIILRGRSENGSLTIYGQKKYKLTLSGLDLHSSKGAAINSQCPKRVFVHMTEGTVNRLGDTSVYQKKEGEDMKACLFAEGDLIFSGTGVLLIDGKGQNGIASDDGIIFRPGVTIVSGASADAGKALSCSAEAV